MADADSNAKHLHVTDERLLPPRWQDRPLSEVLDHLVDDVHAALRNDLPILDGLAQEVAQVDYAVEPRLLAVAAALTALRSDLVAHLRREERVLFKWIRAGDARAIASIATMRREHDEADDALAALRRATDDYCAPTHASGPWRALYMALARFDRDLVEHHALEEALFVRVAGQRS